MLKLIQCITGIDGLTYQEIALGLVMFAFMFVVLFVLFALF